MSCECCALCVVRCLLRVVCCVVFVAPNSLLVDGCSSSVALVGGVCFVVSS